jgi:hypothetical protein
VNHKATSSVAPRSRLLLAGGLVTALLCGALLAGRLSNSSKPSTGAQIQVVPGIVCHSSHFTLTAQIHAGS